MYTIKVADSNCNVVMVATKPNAPAWQAQPCSVYRNGAVPASTTACVGPAGSTEGGTAQSVQSPATSGAALRTQQVDEGVRSRRGGSRGARHGQAADNQPASGTKGAAAVASVAFRALSVESSALPAMLVRGLRRGSDDSLTTRAIMSTAHKIGREAGFDFDAVDEIRDVFSVSVDADGAIVELRA